MKPVFFIEQNRIDRDSTPQRLFYIAQELGCEAISQKYIPFKEDQDFSFLPTDRPVIFYGSINMVKSFNKSIYKNKIKPFCWFDFDEMSCTSYYTHWGKFLLQRNYAFHTFGEIKRLKDKIYEYYGVDGCIFIRPNTNDKIFTGEVVSFENFDSWFRLKQDWGVGLLQLCVVSSPEVIHQEYRLVIAENCVVAASLYKEKNCLEKIEGCPVEVNNFALEVINHVPWQPDEIYCMDIAISGDLPRLLEVGEVNCAGLYAMNLKDVANAMINVAKKEF